MARLVELRSPTKKFGSPVGGGFVPSKSDGSIPNPFGPDPLGRTSKQILVAALPASIAVRSNAQARPVLNVPPEEVVNTLKDM
jgi:hypothetical protein